MSKILIIGGVAAGAGCAARLRRLDEKAQIIMLERGEYISYANCGLPYHVGDVIQSRDALLVTKPEVMRERFNVDVRTRNEAVSIDRGSKSVRIKDHVTGEEYTESYDKLVIATGSSPLRPRIPGIDSPRILTLWTVPDTDHIRSMIRDQGAKRAVVVGGGFIGLEMAENLHHAGLAVSIVEATDQVMAPVDPEMAMILHKNIRDNGVDLHLSDGVASFEDTTSGVSVKLSSGKILTADLVILSIGVRPNSQIAKEAGLEVNARGGIIVNDRLQTSDPDIYAAGDVIEVEDFISKERTMVPLAGPANKQGRIAADNICGGNSHFHGSQGSSVLKLFSLTAASTGINEKAAQAAGIAYDRVVLFPASHATYYPGAQSMAMKVLYEKESLRLLGAQIVGGEGVDKRIDVLATAIRAKMTALELTELDLSYAPPYSSAKDPVNMAGFMIEDLESGKVRQFHWNEVEDLPCDGNAILLDVRTEGEYRRGHLNGFRNIPLDDLREHLDELDRGKPVYVNCQTGLRSYLACRLLTQYGFTCAHLSGGYSFYQVVTQERQTARSAYPCGMEKL